MKGGRPKRSCAGSPPDRRVDCGLGGGQAETVLLGFPSRNGDLSGASSGWSAL